MAVMMVSTVVGKTCRYFHDASKVDRSTDATMEDSVRLGELELPDSRSSLILPKRLSRDVWTADCFEKDVAHLPLLAIHRIKRTRREEHE